jgi:hypothetical protein
MRRNIVAGTAVGRALNRSVVPGAKHAGDRRL